MPFICIYIFICICFICSHFSAFVMGGVAASVATAVSYPMDVMRTQYIMQVSAENVPSYVGSTVGLCDMGT